MMYVLPSSYMYILREICICACMYVYEQFTSVWFVRKMSIYTVCMYVLYMYVCMYHAITYGLHGHEQFFLDKLQLYKDQSCDATGQDIRYGSTENE